jgi:hypothetical protein
MKQFSIVIMMWMSVFSSSVLADFTASHEVKELLSLLEHNRFDDHTLMAMIDVKIQKNKALAPYKLQILSFLKENAGAGSDILSTLKEEYKTLTSGGNLDKKSEYIKNAAQSITDKMPGMISPETLNNSELLKGTVDKIKAMLKEKNADIDEMFNG